MFRYKFHHSGTQYLAVDAFEFRRSVWKMLADVPQGQCSEQCVAKCVNGYISVGVRDASYRALNLHASEPEGKAFRQCVHVISVTDSSVHVKIISTNVNKKP